MELIILGTSAGYANKNDGCSSYLLKYKDKHYLIDVGPGAVSYRCNWRRKAEKAGDTHNIGADTDNWFSA